MTADPTTLTPPADAPLPWRVDSASARPLVRDATGEPVLVEHSVARYLVACANAAPGLVAERDAARDAFDELAAVKREEMRALIEEGMAAGHAARPQVCGWCVQAAGGAESAWVAAPRYTLDEVQAHTLTCPRNPLVTERDEYRTQHDNAVACWRREVTVFVEQRDTALAECERLTRERDKAREQQAAEWRAHVSTSEGLNESLGRLAARDAERERLRLAVSELRAVLEVVQNLDENDGIARGKLYREDAPTLFEKKDDGFGALYLGHAIERVMRKTKETP